MKNFLKITGEVIINIGAACLFMMAIIGTISIDLVILAAIVAASEKSNRREHSFLTGYLWGSMFSNRHHHNDDYSVMLIISPITTAIAITLSIFLGVPMVGLALAAGWLASLGIMGVGIMLYNIGDNCFNSVDTSTNRFSTQTSSSNQIHTNLSNSFTPPPQEAVVISDYDDSANHSTFLSSIQQSFFSTHRANNDEPVMAEAYYIPSPSAPPGKL